MILSRYGILSAYADFFRPKIAQAERFQYFCSKRAIKYY